MRPFMMLLFLCTAMLSINTSAQSREGKLEYKKTQQPVAVIEFNYPPRQVEAAIKDYMAKRGYRVSEKDGFDIFRAVRLDSVSDEASDIYFKIEPRSRREKDASVVSLLPAKVNENIIERTGNDEGRLNGAKLFLNNLAPYVDEHDLQVQVDGQTELLLKAKKKYKNLQDDEADLQNRIRKLQSSLANNKVDQEKQAGLLKDNIHQDDAAVKKAHKKMDNLIDDQMTAQKRLRTAEADLEKNRQEQELQRREIDKQQEALDALKARQKKSS